MGGKRKRREKEDWEGQERLGYCDAPHYALNIYFPTLCIGMFWHTLSNVSFHSSFSHTHTHTHTVQRIMSNPDHLHWLLMPEDGMATLQPFISMRRYKHAYTHHTLNIGHIHIRVNVHMDMCAQPRAHEQLISIHRLCKPCMTATTHTHTNSIQWRQLILVLFT